MNFSSVQSALTMFPAFQLFVLLSTVKYHEFLIGTLGDYRIPATSTLNPMYCCLRLNLDAKDEHHANCVCPGISKTVFQSCNKDFVTGTLNNESILLWCQNASVMGTISAHFQTYWANRKAGHFSLAHLLITTISSTFGISFLWSQGRKTILIPMSNAKSTTIKQ